MLMPDLALSRRLELASAQCDADYVTAMYKLTPESKAAAEPLSAGYAVFLGKPFPVNHATCLGLSGPVDVDEVERIEAFYSERDMPTKLHLSPLADASLFACLGERGYKVDRFFTVYARELSDFVEEETGEISVMPAMADEDRLWARVATANGSGQEPSEINENNAWFQLALAAFHRPHSTCFFARIGNETAGTCAVSIQNEIAYFSYTATHPRYRNRGVQGAMIRARLAMAAAAGCHLAVATTIPGNNSMRNVLRAGFQTLYTQVHLVREMSVSEAG
jgi:GNAT superfamily N-acetyltransferase